MKTTTAVFDKVLMIRNAQDNALIAICVHDTTNQTRQLYTVELMDMDTIQLLLNHGQPLNIQNGTQIPSSLKELDTQ